MDRTVCLMLMVAGLCAGVFQAEAASDPPLIENVPVNAEFFARPEYLESIAKELEKQAERKAPAMVPAWWMRHFGDKHYNTEGHRNLDQIGGGNLLRRNLDAIGGGNLVRRNLDSIGGGHLVRRNLDAIGGGNLIRRNLDSIGGGNLIRSVRHRQSSDDGDDDYYDE